MAFLSADNSKYYLTFIGAVTEVFAGSGISGFERKNLKMSGVFAMSYDLNIIVSFMGDIQGNIGISMTSETAAKIAAALMSKEGDVAPLSITGKKSINQAAVTIADKVIAKMAAEGKKLEASPPTMVVGEKLVIFLMKLQTLSLSLETSVGPVQINVCLENV